MNRFSGSIAVITGAGSGIGKAAAKRLASEGARLLLVGRTESKLQNTAAELNDRYNDAPADIFPADVTKEEDVNRLADKVKNDYGDLHILVNNAGGSRHSSVFETSAIDWEYVQSTNLKSVFLVSKALGKIMIDGRKAEGDNKQINRAIVNTASLSAHQAGVKIPHYSASKAGVINLTKSVALELAPYGIRVNSVSPGFAETPLTEQGLENSKFAKAIERNTSLGRVAQPEEIANVIVFAASPEASYMTGSDVLVDGGWMIT